VPLQVIGGDARGRRLRSPRGDTRPTAAILRRSLFDILGPRVSGGRALDLYAGAGTLGIEALSRGAAWCDFVDRDRACANVIAKNLALIDASARGRVHCAPVQAWLQRHRGALRDYDLVFMDPPYGDPGLSQSLAALGTPGRLAETALVAVEHDARHALELPPGLVLRRRVAHGDSAMHLVEVAA
jgi:16S rRNA (guanine966-N2)-methyltransferase